MVGCFLSKSLEVYTLDTYLDLNKYALAALKLSLNHTVTLLPAVLTRSVSLNWPLKRSFKSETIHNSSYRGAR